MTASALKEFLLNQVELFTGFPTDRLEHLLAQSREATFQPGEALVRCGDDGRFLGVMLAGEAEACVTDDGGDRRRLGLLKPGQLFGEMSLMSGDKTMADVIALSTCRVLLIPTAVFSAILVTHMPAVARLSKVMVSRIKAEAEQTQDLAAAAFKRADDPYGFLLRADEPTRILVINCGSSSLKYNLFNTADERGNARGMIEKIGEDGTLHSCISAKGRVERLLERGTHAEAFASMVAELTGSEVGVLRSPSEIDVVGHRVVHGGDKYGHAVVITPDVIADIESFCALAPLHNPVNLLGIREAARLLPAAPAVAVFDTAFHQTMPPHAYLYGLPYEYAQEKGIRRYGFHGTSHKYVALKAAQHLKRPFNQLAIVSCHLGNGASICAIDHGRSVDTSMGFTPAEGLLMGTRCGDLDPAILTHLMRTEGMGHQELDALLNKKGGLKGLSGLSNDMRAIDKAAQEGDQRALLAFKTFCYRVRKYIGAYMAAMGRMDLLIFTGGIGQGSAGVRSLACQGLQFMGIDIDEAKNQAARGPADVCEISVADGAVKVLVVPTDEERMIARETLRTLGRRQSNSVLQTLPPRPVPVEVSAHHVHLSRSDVEALFGSGHQLVPVSELSQPGQFACQEQVTLVGPKGRVEKVRVLGPERKETQVEISMTEQFKLGLQPPIRQSGDLQGSPGLTLAGSAGSVPLERGVICALRHIHMAPEDALAFSLKDRDVVRVRVSGVRDLIFGDVVVRVHPNFRLAMHIDTDEANAGGIATGQTGYIEAVQSRT